VGAKTLKLIGGTDMLGEGIFILVVSLSGSYTDNKYVGNFPNCISAMQYFEEHCSQHKAASCILEKYANLPDDHVSRNAFSFSIKEVQSCGFVGVETREKFLKD